ncbi:cryptochrome/photolyase family protein, partial [Streptomyces goshikiensis]|uniref:cryptochrome/photolyase family protein n=1 Tax=Streptomyces goshikiensis TaxID=1942 RepID=UPI003684C1F5
EPAGGRWNLDHDNREPPPQGVRKLGAPAPYRRRAGRGGGWRCPGRRSASR